MTISTIISGFCYTGIYPFNRYAFCMLPFSESIQPSFDPKVYGISYLPMYTSESTQEGAITILDITFEGDSFSPEEIHIFNRRYENGYDLMHDSRYNRWLQEFHPSDISLCNDTCSSEPHSILSKIVPLSHSENLTTKYSCEKIKSSVNKCGKFEDYGRKRSTEIGKRKKEERAQENERGKAGLSSCTCYLYKTCVCI